MKCEECKDLIAISVFGELTPDAQAQLQAHLEHCSGCAALFKRSEELREITQKKETIVIPDKEKSWEIISGRVLKKKRNWFERFALQKPIFQYSAVLLLLIAGFSAGYFLRSDGVKGSQLAQLQEEISQIREITAASLLRQESLNMRIREIGTSAAMVRSDERPMEFLYHTFVSDSGDNSVQSRSKQTSPLVDIALTLVRQINKSDVY